MEIIFHIGLIKTGSTFLQSQFFPFLEDVKYVGPGNNIFTRKWIVKPLDRILISNEGISGHPFKEEEIGYSYFNQFKNAVNNILSLSSKAKIIVGFREPASFIQSCYKQKLHEGGTTRWEDFINEQNEEFLDEFKFSKYIKFLYETMDVKDVFLYDQKDLQTETDNVLSAMSLFITGKYQHEVINNVNTALRVNTSVKLAFEPYLIWLNKFNMWTKNNFNCSLTIRIFGITLNQRVLIQHLLPKIIISKTERNLNYLKYYYLIDWEETKDMINVQMLITLNSVDSRENL